MAKANFTSNNRTFEITAHPDFNGAMIEYMIWEVVRPKWKFFRTRYCTGGSFWIEDFSTIREGLQYVLNEFLAEEKRDQENKKKFEDFENE